MTSKTIVFFGDSITQGGVPVWEEQIKKGPWKDVSVINSGIGGHDTRQALARISKDAVMKKPDIIVVEFGLNDSWKEEKGKFYITEEEFRNNYLKIISILKKAGVPVILLVVNHDVMNDYMVAQGMSHRQRNRANNATIRELGKAEGLEVMDLENGLAGEGFRRDDGVHLTGAGNIRYGEVLLKVLKKYL